MSITLIGRYLDDAAADSDDDCSVASFSDAN